jgi:Cell division septal protein
MKKKQAMNEVYKLQAEKRKKNKRRLKLIFAWFKLITLFALAIAAVIFTALSPLFNIKSVEVKGSLYYNKETLVGISGITAGENGFKKLSCKPLDLFKFRFSTIEKIIEDKCPYIKNVKVKFEIPSTIVIDVAERTAVFSVLHKGTSLLIDREGYVLEVLTEGNKSKLPVLKGLDFPAFKLGSKLELAKKEALTDALKVMDVIIENDKTYKINMYKLIDSIDTGDTSSIKISLDSRIVVNIGDLQDLNYRISATKTFYDKNIKKSEKGALDFTSGERPVFSPDDEGDGK